MRSLCRVLPSLNARWFEDEEEWDEGGTRLLGNDDRQALTTRI